MIVRYLRIMTNAPPVFALDRSSNAVTLRVAGDFVLSSLAEVDADLRALHDLRPPEGFTLDVSGLGALDSAGAFVIDRTLRAGHCAGPFPPLRIVGAHPAAQRLVAAARQASPECPPPPAAPITLVKVVAVLGRAIAHFSVEAAAFIGFFGQLVVAVFQFLVRPWQARWRSIFHHIEEAGLKALPIIMLLSFFIGMVLAYLGAIQLQAFGATIYVVELVGVSVLREFGVALAGIVLAGRSASAFAAEIGAMRMQEEVDALRIMGLRPVAVLVAPRLLALMLVAPLLALGANLAGVFGGLLVAWLRLGISPALFLNRAAQIVPLENLWIGLIKAPVFAVLIAMSGARHGLLVEGDVASLGRRTTAAVVQALFLIILFDAAFAVFFQEMGW